MIIIPDIVEPSFEEKEPLDHFLWPMKHITTTSAEDGQTASYLPQLSLHLHESFSIRSMNNSHSIIKGKNSF
jgi:hypothetical protein